MPPGKFKLAVTAVGALALGVGAAAAVRTNLWGIPLALGGLVLLAWAVRRP
jgi:hypothetical protein